MLQTYNNSLELKQIYDYNNQPFTSYDYANNLGYKLGATSHSNNLFDPYIDKLVNQGILIKIYDFLEGDLREGLYQFLSDNTQISFYGTNVMNYKLFYEFND